MTTDPSRGRAPWHGTQPDRICHENNAAISDLEPTAKTVNFYFEMVQKE